ncbi:MAG: YraN family protein [Candidatus Moranbacteria bacterium]|nr:YraN family protein [Candidatus Moranbacteria bacterium]
MIFWRKKENSPGELGEKLAAKHLKKKGYRILEFNFSNTQGRRLGEIDVIAKDGNSIVFVEVKTRMVRPGEVVVPEENIDRRKLHKLEKIANFYLRKNKLTESDYRFDAVSVWLDEERRCEKIKHLESIFIE